MLPSAALASCAASGIAAICAGVIGTLGKGTAFLLASAAFASCASSGIAAICAGVIGTLGKGAAFLLPSAALASCASSGIAAICADVIRAFGSAAGDAFVSLALLDATEALLGNSACVRADGSGVGGVGDGVGAITFLFLKPAGNVGLVYVVLNALPVSVGVKRPLPQPSFGSSTAKCDHGLASTAT